MDAEPDTRQRLDGLPTVDEMRLLIMGLEAQTPGSLVQRLYSRYRYYSFPLRYRVWALRENMWHRIARMMPRTLLYFAVITVWAHGTSGKWSNTHPDDLGWNEALKRWEKP